MKITASTIWALRQRLLFRTGKLALGLLNGTGTSFSGTGAVPPPSVADLSCSGNHHHGLRPFYSAADRL